MTSMGVANSTEAEIRVTAQGQSGLSLVQWSVGQNTDMVSATEDLLGFDADEALATLRAAAAAFAQPVMVDDDGRLTINEAGMIFDAVYPVRIADGLYHVVLASDSTVEIYEVLE